MTNLFELLDTGAVEAGGKTAIAWAGGSLSYGELRESTLRAAAGFHAAGIRKGDCVAIVHRNDARFVIAYFALSRLGAIAVPINFMVQKPNELAYMLKDCGAVGLVTQKEFLRGLDAAAAQCPELRRFWITDGDAAITSDSRRPFAELSGDPSSLPAVPSDPEMTAAILYTSGTTGNPKGVMLTHRNLLSNADASIGCFSPTSSDVLLCILPMFHSFAWTAVVLLSLRLKARFVLAPAVVPARAWLDLMAKEGVTLFVAVPQVYAVLAKQATGFKRFVLRWWFFRRTRLGVSGAAPLAETVMDAFESALGVPILEGYGLTETSPVVSVNAPEARRRGSVGRPVAGVLVKIVGEDGVELPAGAEGEICVKGDNVMKGYYNHPEATRDTFTADGWLKTGDVGVVDADGYLYIRDRKKDMIIIKGLKVFSAQVESVLLEHPGVEEAAVIGIPDEHGDETIKAFVVPRPGTTLEKSELLQFCRSRFDPYKRPRDVEIVDSLPKNALQKVLKRDLRQRELARRAAAA